MASIRIDANAQAALAEFAKAVQAQNAIADGQDKIAGKSREAAGEERRLGSLRRKLLRETNTAQEEYKRRLGEAEKALKGVEGEERRLAQVRSDLREQLFGGLDTQREKLGEVEGSLGDVGDANDDAFRISRIVNYQNAVTAATGVVTAMVEALRRTREEADRVGEAFSEIGPSSGNLVQLAGGDSALRDKLFAASDQVFASGVVRDRQSADDLVFELQAADRLNELKFFTQLGAIDNAAELARSAGLISAGFRGGDSVGTGADIVSKSIAAAAPATGVTPSEIAQGVAAASAAAKPFGLTDEELFTGVSLVSQTTGDGKQAGTQVRSLLSALTRRGLADELRGQGFAKILETANAQFTNNRERIEFLGGDDAARGFSPLEDSRVVAQRLREIQAAQANQLSVATIENAFQSDRIYAPIARRSAENQDALIQDRRAIGELQADTEQAGFRSLIRESFGDGVANFSDFGFSVLRLIPGVEQEFIDNRRVSADFDRSNRIGLLRDEQDGARRGVGLQQLPGGLEARQEQAMRDGQMIEKLGELISETKKNTRAVKDGAFKGIPSR